ncbi:hypothetical protein GIB67_037301 [Kingdonia uniflora]|uniref:Protein kinase domain-containing protein n=1 Tax=Kingdonia uniflora TaxID=39325 RepID=A0A7J7MSQ5_9MAGN|nr:hypothetical protein GIB67_037301 [Kingdonia uniflora]
MPSWWGKSSSKEVKKKTNKESFIDTLHRKFKTPSEEKCIRSGGSRRRNSDTGLEKGGSRSRAESLSPSTSNHVSRCQSFAERSLAQPLPLPEVLHLANIGRTNSGTSTPRPGLEKRPKPLLFLPLPRPGCITSRTDPADIDTNLATASVSSDSSTYSDDPTNSRHPSPRATAANSPSSTLQRDPYQSPIVSQRNSRETPKLANPPLNNHVLSTSPRRGPLSMYAPTLQIPNHGAFASAPDSSMSSPSRSPMRVFGAEHIASSAFWAGKPYLDVTLLGSGHCSSPGSGHNSGHNSMGGDMSGQLFLQYSRGSPEFSPIPSPRMTSPGPSSRIHSGAVTPLHPRAGGVGTEAPTNWSDDGKQQQSHRLPLPPSVSSPFSPSNSVAPTPSSVPRSPGRAENPTSPGSRWKKGRLLGRGTFGHVYVGFNRCVHKTEITLLSRLRHQNIVQYYGTETVDDKLYIYLEYVSGGSIYKLLQDYGQFGEVAIRSYTQQILSGLAYLHAKNTVHRDIKGANILVDPNGRVKLADFGMAKHITGQSCPLSFKGSPYWMAPEVIKNVSGCNLAVDIWSLGCTVLEMATTKPPWSQYEGVAAMFKIGNSKENPAIPDHLSDDGKDFVRKCLQRNPYHRPTASQLLEHPFVKNAAPLERPILGPEPSEIPLGVANNMRFMGVGHARNLSSLDSEGLATQHPIRSAKSAPVYSASHTPMNVSCSVSPIGSPLLHSRSPQHMNNGRMSPSPISTPRTPSGASTPLTGGNGAIPFHQLMNSTYSHEGGYGGSLPRSLNGFHTSNSSSSTFLHDPKPDLFRGSHVFREQLIAPSDNDVLGKPFGRPAHGDLRSLYDTVCASRPSISAALKGSCKIQPFSRP